MLILDRPIVQRSSFDIIRNVDNIDYIVFSATFNDTIYAKQNSTSPPMLLDVGEYQKIITKTCSDGTIKKYSKLSLTLNNLFSIRCINPTKKWFNITSTGIGSKDPCLSITSAVAVSSTANAGGSFLNLLKGGLTLNENVEQDTISLVYPITSSAAKTYFTFGNGISCSFVSVGTSKISSFTNAAGEVIVLTGNSITNCGPVSTAFL